MYQKTDILGRVTHDPELKYTKTGKACVALNVATNYKISNEKEITEYHTVVFWEKQAIYLCDQVKKGTVLFVSGRNQTRSWEASDGTKRYKTEIVGGTFQLLAGHVKKEFSNTEQPKAPVKEFDIEEFKAMALSENMQDEIPF